MEYIVDMIYMRRYELYKAMIDLNNQCHCKLTQKNLPGDLIILLAVHSIVI